MTQEIAIYLTSLLTILGWVVTYYYKRKILSHQIESGKMRDARQLIIPARIQRLTEVRTWVDRSLQIATLRVENLAYGRGSFGRLAIPTADLRKKFSDWLEEGTKHASLLVQMDDIYTPKDRGVSNSVMRLIEAMIIFTTDDTEPPIEDSALADHLKNLLAATHEPVARLLVGIDNPMELCAFRELGYKK